MTLVIPQHTRGWKQESRKGGGLIPDIPIEAAAVVTEESPAADGEKFLLRFTAPVYERRGRCLINPLSASFYGEM